MNQRNHNENNIRQEKPRATGLLNKFIRHLMQPVYLLTFIAFFYDTLLFYVVWIIEKLPYIGSIAGYIVPFFVFIGVISLIQAGYIRRLNIKVLMFIAFVSSTVIMSMLIYPNTLEIVKERYLPITFGTCLPIFLLATIIPDDDEMFDFIGYVSQASIIIGIIYIYYMLNFGNPAAINDDNMGLSYKYLMVELFTIMYSFRRKSLFGILLSVVGAILILSLGTRGPVVLILVYVAVCLLDKVLLDRKKRFPVILLSGITIFIMTVYYRKLMIVLINYTSKIGLSTRVMEKLLQANVLNDVDRNQIASLLLERIKDRPFLGYGVAGEWQFVNWSAHNIYLSFLTNFGCILGPLMILFLIVLTLKALLKNNNENSKYLILMFAVLVFAKGFFSGDPLSFEVFFLVGFCFNQIQKNI